jgi:hypothetical protein
MPTRSQRRADSRDEARANPIPPRPRSHGDVGLAVHAPRRMPVRPPSERSGQTRRNTKRTARAEYWRTVIVQVWPDMEPYFRQHLHLFGDGTRIVSRTASPDGPTDLHVHIPGAPPNATLAEAAVYQDNRGEWPVPFVDHIDWFDAAGQRIEDAGQMAEVAS